MTQRVLATILLCLLPALASAQRTMEADRFKLLTGPCTTSSGASGPESVVTGKVCDQFVKTDGTNWVKISGTGTTGWLQLAAGAFVSLQASTPGTAQTGHLNISGTGIFGGTVLASGTGGFASSTYVSNARNPIWRFGNSDASGLSYFQGTAGLKGTSVDTISLHFGTATAAGSPFRFEQDGTFTMDGNAGFGTTAPTTFKVQVAGDVGPNVGYSGNLGLLTKKWLTLHAAELWVETLVAQDTIATIGGRILVGPTTTLVADLAAAATTIHVKHNQLASGNRVYLEANGAVEFLSIDSAPGGSAGNYTYTVTRNLDGSGANDWSAGDAVFDTSASFIDLYSVRGVKSASEYGPTIVGNVRNSATYNDWSPRWAIGNMRNLYGYGSNNVYGVGLGDWTKSWVTLDDTNGLRIGNAGNVKMSITTAGVATFVGDGNGVTNINGGNIQTGTITADKITVGYGSNMLTNVEFRRDFSESAGNTAAWADGDASDGLTWTNWGVAYAAYTPTGSGVGWRSDGGTSGSGAKHATYYGQIAVQAGTTIQFSAYLGCHRTHWFVAVGFYDAGGGGWTGFTYGTTVTDATPGGTSLASFGRSVVTVVVPTGKTQMLLALYTTGIDQSNPYLFFTHLMLTEVPTGTTATVPWAPGGVTLITAGNIQTGTITANEISATAIDAMTITGATIRTASSASRVQMDTTGIWANVGTGPENTRSFRFVSSGLSGSTYGLYAFDSGVGTRTVEVLNTATSTGTVNASLQAKASDASEAEWTVSAGTGAAPYITGQGDILTYGKVWIRNGVSFGTGSGLRVDDLVGIGRDSVSGFRVAISGVGTTSSTYAFHVTNSSAGTSLFYLRDDGYSWVNSAWNVGSDRALKQNIEYFSAGLDVINALKPAVFDYIGAIDPDVVKNPTRSRSAGLVKQRGFIAQDVQAVVPDLVSVIDPATGMLGYQPTAIIPYLTAAIQELDARLKSAEKRLEEIK